MKRVNVAVENLSMYNDYFQLLGCEKAFDLNQDLLYENYIKLQRLFHPDKLVNKSNAEKIQAIEYTTHLNKAYEVLKDEKTRAMYLLSLQGIKVNQEADNTFNLDPETLEYILELTENIDMFQLEEMKNECIENFRIHYENGELKQAALAITKLQYLDKIFVP